MTRPSFLPAFQYSVVLFFVALMWWGVGPAMSDSGDRWLPVPRQPFAQTPREDLTVLIRDANAALHLPTLAQSTAGEPRTAADASLWLRVNVATFSQLLAAPKKSNALVGALNRARMTPPTGDAPTHEGARVVPLQSVKQVCVHLGDSITYGVNMDSFLVQDTWSGRVFNGPPFLINPVDTRFNSLDQGFIKTLADAERQVFHFGIPSAQMVNADPERAGNPTAYSIPFPAAGVDVTTNTLTLPTTQGAGAGRWVQVVSTGTPPAPLVRGRPYYIGKAQPGGRVQLHATARDAIEGSHPIRLTDQGSGDHRLVVPTPSWRALLGRFVKNIRVTPGQQLVWVIFMGTNDVRYNPSLPIVGPGSIATNHLMPFMASLRALITDPQAKVVFVTPIARTGDPVLNQRLVAFRNYVQAVKTRLKLDAVVDPGQIVVDGLHPLDPATPGVARFIRLTSADINPAADTLAARPSLGGDPLWPDTLTGLPVRFWPGRGVTLPAPLTPTATYYLGAISQGQFKLYPSAADARQGLNPIDITASGVTPGNAYITVTSAYYHPDGTHPLAAGQALIGGAVRQALNTLLTP